MVKIDNLTFSFGDNEILRDFSCHIKKGERVCFRGVSGKGKTTLLRIIMKLEKGYVGSAFVEKNALLSAVFQEDILLPWYTAEENVSLVSNDSEAEKWLSLFDLSDSISLLPSKLSGGMKRRVALARACSVNPDILILDEAFKGLDTELKENIIEILIREFADKTIIFTSHDDGEIEALSTRVIHL